MVKLGYNAVKILNGKEWTSVAKLFADDAALFGEIKELAKNCQ